MRAGAQERMSAEAQVRRGPGISPIGHELLDDPAADDDAVVRSLRNVARANVLFGGHAAVRAGLGMLLRHVRGTITVLDVGTGAADIPRMARAWGARHGLVIQAFGLERHRAAARLARDTGLPLVVACGSALPVRDGGVDIVVLSQVLHHLDQASSIAFLEAAGRAARRGVVVAELGRSRVAAAGFRLAGRVLGFDRHTRDDGATSLRRGYSAAELEQLIRRAGGAPQVRRLAGIRLVAVWPTGS